MTNNTVLVTSRSWWTGLSIHVFSTRRQNGNASCYVVINVIGSLMVAANWSSNDRCSSCCGNAHGGGTDCHLTFKVKAFELPCRPSSDELTGRWKKPNDDRSVAIVHGIGSGISLPDLTTASPKIFTMVCFLICCGCSLLTYRLLFVSSLRQVLQWFVRVRRNRLLGKKLWLARREWRVIALLFASMTWCHSCRTDVVDQLPICLSVSRAFHDGSIQY